MSCCTLTGVKVASRVSGRFVVGELEVVDTLSPKQVTDTESSWLSMVSEVGEVSADDAIHDTMSVLIDVVKMGAAGSVLGDCLSSSVSE